MDLFHCKKTKCEDHYARFRSYEDGMPGMCITAYVVKCSMCCRQFLHEKDRLHRIKEKGKRYCSCS